MTPAVLPERTWVHRAIRIGIVGSLVVCFGSLLLKAVPLALVGFLGLIASGVASATMEDVALRRLRARAGLKIDPALSKAGFVRTRRRWRRAAPPSAVVWQGFTEPDPGRIAIAALLQTREVLPFEVRYTARVGVDAGIVIGPRRDREAALRTGDRDFDRAFRIEGPDRAVRALLGPDVRDALRTGPNDAELIGGELVVKLPGDDRLPQAMAAADTLAASIRAAAEVPALDRLRAHLLGAADSQRQIQPLVAHLVDDPEPAVRAALTEAGARWPWIDVALATGATDTDSATLSDAIQRALDEAGRGVPWLILKPAVDRLLALLPVADAVILDDLVDLPEVTNRLIRTLMTGHRPAAEPVIRRRLLEGIALRRYVDERYGDDVIEVVSAEPHERLEEVLIGLLDHHDEAVSTRAVQALARVGGRPAAEAMREMRRFGIEGRAYAFRGAFEAASKVLDRRLEQTRAERAGEVGGGLSVLAPSASTGGLSPAEDGRLALADDPSGDPAALDQRR